MITDTFAQGTIVIRNGHKSGTVVSTSHMPLEGEWCKLLMEDGKTVQERPRALVALNACKGARIK